MSNYLREIKAARIDATRLTVELTDGSAFTVPLTFYPTLLLRYCGHATGFRRSRRTISQFGHRSISGRFKKGPVRP